MRVALVTTSWPAHEEDPSGHFVRAHARELEREGHSVRVVSPSPGGAFGWPGAAARLRARPTRALEAACWLHAARRTLARADVDLVVAHWSVPCGWPVGTASRAPLHVVSHGGDVRLLAATPAPARRAIVRRLASRASVWEVASDSLLRELLDALDGDARVRVERIARVRAPRFELPDVRDAIAARRRELGAAFVAVCVGRLVASKRVDRVIAHVAGEEPRPTLVVVGDGPERARLESLARQCGIDGRFVGNVGRCDALAWIGAADVLLHASEAEGLSTVIREAEALGTPVTRLGG
jgi:teichuronic acid biosynthesis glycosyltransferase TuaC